MVSDSRAEGWAQVGLADHGSGGEINGDQDAVEEESRLHAAQVPQVRAWLMNYRRSKAALEAICELNQRLLRPEGPAPVARRPARD